MNYLKTKYRIKITDNTSSQFDDESGYVNPQLHETCLHDKCTICHGTGKKPDGTLCVHFLSCGCSKCRWWC